VLGEVEETIYVVEDDDNEDNELKVRLFSPCQISATANPFADREQEIGNAIRARYVFGSKPSYDRDADGLRRRQRCAYFTLLWLMRTVAREQVRPSAVRL
jgi:hypothetical protein